MDCDRYESPIVRCVFQYFPEESDRVAATVEMSLRKTDAVPARASLLVPVPVSVRVSPVLAYVTAPTATAAAVNRPTRTRRRADINRCGALTTAPCLRPAAGPASCAATAA